MFLLFIFSFSTGEYNKQAQGRKLVIGNLHRSFMKISTSLQELQIHESRYTFRIVSDLDLTVSQWPQFAWIMALMVRLSTAVQIGLGNDFMLDWNFTPLLSISR